MTAAEVRRLARSPMVLDDDYRAEVVRQMTLIQRDQFNRLFHRYWTADQRRIAKNGGRP